MDRRDFISAVKGFFGARGHNETTLFFGIQVAIRYSANDNIRKEFYRILGGYAKSESASEKKQYYQQIRELLLKHMSDIAYGYWDYITEEEAAIAEYEQWTQEIQDVFEVESDEVNSDDPTKEKYHLVLTQVFLLRTVPKAEPFFTKIEAIPAEIYFSRSSFSKLLGAISLIDFSFCLNEALFLMPPKGGYTQAEIEGEGWEYLRKI